VARHRVLVACLSTAGSVALAPVNPTAATGVTSCHLAGEYVVSGVMA
jgi:hypothetical protein